MAEDANACRRSAIHRTLPDRCRVATNQWLELIEQRRGGHQMGTLNLDETSQMENLQPFPSQVAVCEKYGAQPQRFLRHDRLGISLATMNLVPINGLRIPALSGSSGWFIYGGVKPS